MTTATRRLEGQRYLETKTNAALYKQRLRETHTALRILLVFAQNSADLQKCHDMQVVAYTSSGSWVLTTASRALQRFLLSQRCCYSKKIRTCQCHKAQAVRPLALELLGLMETCSEDRVDVDITKPVAPVDAVEPDVEVKLAEAVKPVDIIQPVEVEVVQPIAIAKPIEMVKPKRPNSRRHCLPDFKQMFSSRRQGHDRDRN